MSEKFKAIKATLLVGIFLLSALLVVAPSSTAADTKETGLINLSSSVSVNWSSDKSEEVIEPRGTPQKLQISVKYYVASGGTLGGFDELAERAYYGSHIYVHLELIKEEQYDWLEASLSDYDPDFIIGDHLPETKTVELTVTLDEDAPGYLTGEIKIKATVKTLSKLIVPNLIGFEKTFGLKFTPAYRALVDPQVQGSNTKVIGPTDTAVFPIDVENKGNERTTVFFTIDNVPSGWTAIISDSITLDVNEKSTVYLSVQPPKGFGYHYDIETISVTVTPARANKLTETGASRPVTVQIESRGLSFVGAEVILLPIILILAVAIILFYYFIYKPKQMK